MTFLPSTYYAQQDRLAGQPWRTLLPFRALPRPHDYPRPRARFPVHYHVQLPPWLLRRPSASFPRLRANRPVESETFLSSSGSTTPRTWLRKSSTSRRRHPLVVPHGITARTGRPILHQLADEYHVNAVAPEASLPEPALPAGLEAIAMREAVRSLKGVKLREERFALDGTPRSRSHTRPRHPPTRCGWCKPRGRQSLRRASGDSRRGADLAIRSRARRPPHLAYARARNRRSRQARAAATVTYPRLVADATLPPAVQQAQAQRTVILATIAYTNDVDTPDITAFVAYSTTGHELTGIAGPPGAILTRDALLQHVARLGRGGLQAAAGNWARAPPASAARKSSTRSDDLQGPLPTGTQGRLGIAHEGYQLAFNGRLITQQFGNTVPDAMLQASDTSTAMATATGGNRAAPPSSRNRSRPFLPSDCARDALGSSSTASYVAQDLLVTEVETRSAIVRAPSTTTASSCRCSPPTPTTTAWRSRSIRSASSSPRQSWARSAQRGRYARRSHRARGNTTSSPGAIAQQPTSVHTFFREQHARLTRASRSA